MKTTGHILMQFYTVGFTCQIKVEYFTSFTFAQVTTAKISVSK